MSESKDAPSGSKARSPWLWVGLGCGLSVLLTFGGCIAFLGIVGNQVSKEMAKPINSAEVIAQLGDIPVYKPSTFNETMTKALKAGSSIIPGQIMTGAAFEVADEPSTVIAWYEKQLIARGYQKVENQSSQREQAAQVTFEKQATAIVVQIQKSVMASKGHTLMLMRVKGLGSQSSP